MSQCENCADLQHQLDDAVSHAAEAERRASEAEEALEIARRSLTVFAHHNWWFERDCPLPIEESGPEWTFFPLSRIAAVALHFNCANYPKPFPTAGGVLYAQLTAPGQWDTHVIQGLPGGPDATDAVPHEIEKDGRTYRATGSYYIHPWYPFYERVDSGVTDDQA